MCVWMSNAAVSFPIHSRPQPQSKRRHILFAPPSIIHPFRVWEREKNPHHRQYAASPCIAIIHLKWWWWCSIPKREPPPLFVFLLWFVSILGNIASHVDDDFRGSFLPSFLPMYIWRNLRKLFVYLAEYPPFVSPDGKSLIRRHADWSSWEWTLLVVVDRLWRCSPLGSRRGGEVNMIGVLVLLVRLVSLQSFRVSETNRLFRFGSRFGHRWSRELKSSKVSNFSRFTYIA